MSVLADLAVVMVMCGVPKEERHDRLTVIADTNGDIRAAMNKADNQRRKTQMHLRDSQAEVDHLAVLMEAAIDCIPETTSTWTPKTVAIFSDLYDRHGYTTLHDVLHDTYIGPHLERQT